MSVASLLLFYFFSFKIGVCQPISIKSRCDAFEACNVIHNRYWLPNLVERQCMCPINETCSSSNSKQENPFTMNVNSRTQLQFCRPRHWIPTPLPMCSDQELSVHQTRTSNQIRTKVICKCGRRSFLKFYARATNRRRKSITFKYRCLAMPQCRSDQL